MKTFGKKKTVQKCSEGVKKQEMLCSALKTKQILKNHMVTWLGVRLIPLAVVVLVVDVYGRINVKFILWEPWGFSY